MGKWIKSDGKETQVRPADGKFYSLKQLQRMVGGYIETVKLPPDLLMVVNEEGRQLGLQMNRKASRRAMVRLHRPMVIYGNAVLIKQDELE